MNFSLDGGLMLAVAVLVWVFVYIPNWGRKPEGKSEASSLGRNFSKSRQSKQKNVENGVSQLVFRNKFFRPIRAIFATILFASLALTGYAIFKSFENISWLITAGVSLAVFLTAASTLRASRGKIGTTTQLTLEQLEAQRARIAYSIRESALPNPRTEQLFDERAWVETPLPQSDFARRIGELQEVSLASVSNLDAARAAENEKKLDPEELNRILERRRAV